MFWSEVARLIKQKYTITMIASDSMEKSSSLEANSSSTDPEILQLSLYSKGQL
jgi:hypothetical protein